jgi:tRNA-Thr(GGU) m(6)t(6)A37 methyltransferase TsaA
VVLHFILGALSEIPQRSLREPDRKQQTMDSIQFIGKVQSSLKSLEDCPLQESENAPVATIKVEEKFIPAIKGLKPGSKIVILTWLHRGDRSTVAVHPRNDPNAPLTGVFATRSNDRPNPIGLHHAEIKEVKKNGEIVVSNLEVLDGTPVVDIKIDLDR